eukprot:UN25756
MLFANHFNHSSFVAFRGGTFELGSCSTLYSSSCTCCFLLVTPFPPVFSSIRLSPWLFYSVHSISHRLISEPFLFLFFPPQEFLRVLFSDVRLHCWPH